MSNCKITIEITPDEVIVDAKNWESISNVILERAHYAVVKRFQVLRAQKLGKLHAEKMLSEAAEKSEKTDFAEELANVIK